jgi:hypothetical protein
VSLNESAPIEKVKKVAHEYPLTLCWITAINLVGWTLTVLTCH